MTPRDPRPAGRPRARAWALGAAVLALVAGAVFALSGRGGPFGRGEPGLEGVGGGPPEKASPAGGAAPAPGDAAGKAPAGAVLFGRPKAERTGIGAVAVRVLRWQDPSPVADARCLVTGTGNGGESVDARATTDARGAATLPSVPAGDEYVLRVESTDGLSTVLPGVAVAAGRTRDLGTVYLGKKGGVSGRVVDDHDRPIAGAEVRAYAGYGGLFDLVTNVVDVVGSLDREPTPLDRATTDAKGEFAIASLSPGPVTLRATAPGRLQAVRHLKVTPEGAIGGGPTLVLEPGAVVAGVVVDPAGAPVAGAQLSLLPQSGGDPDQMLFGRVFATTDASGRFRAVVPDGESRIGAFVAAPGYPTLITPPFRAGDESVRIVLRAGTRLDLTVLERGTNRPIPGASVVISVGDTPDEDRSKGGAFVSATTDAQGTAAMSVPAGFVQMGMVSAPGHGGGMFSPGGGGMGAMFGGDVEQDVPAKIEAGKPATATLRLAASFVLKGRVKDEAGKPVAGAEVRSVGMFGSGASSARSGSDGSYRLTGLTAGSMMILVVAPGWVQDDDPESVSLTAGGSDKEETPKPGSEIERDFVLRPAATVRGRVVDAAGNPVAGAQVRIEGGVSLNELFPGPSPQEGTTGADGSYVLFDVDPKAGKGKDDVAIVDTDVVPPGAPKPPPSAPPEPKGLRVRAEAEGWVTGLSAPFQATGGSTASAPAVVLSRGSTLEGVVLDASGRGVAGARVEWTVSPAEGESDGSWKSSASERSTRARADGSFTVDTLPKGSVVLTASAEGHAPVRKTVDVDGTAAKPAGGARVEVRLKPAAVLRGRVTERDGSPVAGASVSVSAWSREGAEHDEEYVAGASGVTDARGDFALTGLAAGRADVLVSAEGHKRLRVTLVAGAAAADVVLERRSPEDVKRLQEIGEEVAAIRTKLVAAKTDAEREALEKRLGELSTEKSRLANEDVGGFAPGAMSGD